MSITSHTIERLLTKSKEAFVLAVELYNRPTLKYHAESCSIFLCNAWELMLKAQLVKTQGIDSIYFPDDPDRTISVTDCVKRVFTNDKDPVRINLHEVINFRNTNTHFITDEYEIVYGPFLQSCVRNYADKLLEFHDHSVSDLMPENHLSLSIRRGSIEPEVIRAKYEPRVAEQLLAQNEHTAEATGIEGNSKIAAKYETTLRLVKKEKDADFNVFVTKDAEIPSRIIRDVKDPRSYYPYTTTACIEEIDKRLKKAKVKVSYKGEERPNFNSFHFGLFVKAFHLKSNDDYSFDRKVDGEANSSWLYSEQTVVFISDQIIKDPTGCIDKLKAKVAKQSQMSF